MVAHGRLAWVRRLSFAAVLIAAAVAPGAASGGSSGQCGKAGCASLGMVRWTRPLPGRWVAQGGDAGTVPEEGQAYAALGDTVAAAGSGMTVSGYAARTGRPLWTTELTGFRAGAAIISVRVWPGVVTVGVGLPAVAAAPGGAATGPARDEVLLRAGNGRRIRVYPAAQFGGAVAAGPRSAVIVGQHAVTSYANRTGDVLWRRDTGRVPLQWQADGNDLYLAIAAKGYLGTAPVTALRRINLRNGAERMIHPRGAAFTGSLGFAAGGVVLFSAASAVRAYSGTTGRLLWHVPGALPDTVDAVTGRLVLVSGNTLIEVDPATGHILAHVPGAAVASSSGLYAVRNGDVLGIDHGAMGKAWGYNVAAQQVLWTSRPLPWPHYFVDLSGIGGSAPPGQNSVLLAICARAGPQLPGATSAPCLRPELVVLSR